MTTAKSSMTTLRRRTILAMAVSAIGLTGVAKAQGGSDLVDLEVVDRETGEPLRVWRHGGRLFVAGRPGARYSLRVSNRTEDRVLVVMSVDGVNILTGQTAGYNQRGYVFEPFQSYDVSGWRKSDREVAAFTFASLSRSYAARTGRPGDVGVIGLAIFRERVEAPIAVGPAVESSRSRRDAEDSMSELAVTGRRAAPPPTAGRAASAPAARVAPYEGAMTAQRREEKLGTAHGQREWSVATTVPFERATAYPQLVRRIEYDSYANLVAMGVIRPRWDGGRRPQPFPSSPGYVPDPPGGR